MPGHDPAEKGPAGCRRGRRASAAGHDDRGLSKLNPIVRPDGHGHRGQRVGINDGSCALLLASEDAVRAHGLTPRARYVASAVAGVAPRVMGIGPVPATRKLLARTGLTIDQMDVIELNEAFAAQALAVLRGLGVPDDAPHVNPNGGAIAIGHPLGASGARLVTTAMYQLARTGGRRALCTMCVGVGQGISLADRTRLTGRPADGVTRAPQSGSSAQDRRACCSVISCSKHGIDSITVEIRSERHVIDRVRAGVLEQTSVDLLHDVGLGERLCREGMRHEGLHIAFDGARHRLDLADLTGGRAITVYGQNEVVRDLIAARRAAGGRVVFDCESVTLSELTSDRPRIDLRTADGAESIVCDYIAGCDGFHGVCRASLSASALQTYDRAYPFAWLGILADAAPSSHELVYSLHERGFALFSMRTSGVTRLYLQCAPDESIDDWSGRSNLE